MLSFINSRYPHANDLTAGDGINTGGFTFNAPSKRKDATYTNRIDWNATSKQQVFGRWNIARRTQTDTVNSVAAQFPGDPETAQIIVRDYAWVVGHTWTINSNIVNQATAGTSRSGLLFPEDFEPSAPTVFTFGAGLSNPYAGFSDQDRFVKVPTYRDDLSIVKGTHSFAFGGSFKPIVSKSGLENDWNFTTVGLGGLLGSLDSSVRPATIGSGTTRSGNYDSAFAFLLGRYANFDSQWNYDTNGTALPLGTGKHRDYRYNELELYAQDTWKMRSDLTLTYGVRWHLYPAPYEKNGFQAGQDVDMRQLFDLRQRNNALGISGETAEPWLRYDLIGKGNGARDLYETGLKNFAPRLSFSYNPSFKDGFLGMLFGDRKTAIRGGGAMVYDRPGGGITFIQDQVSYLFDNSKSTTYGGAATVAAALISDPRFTGIGSAPTVNVPPVITRPFTPFVDSGFPFGLATGEFNYAVDQKFKLPYSIQYSLGFQREMPGNFILEMSYVGRQGRKLFSQADVAQVLNFRDPASGQFLFDALNAVQAQVAAGVTGAAITNQPWFENQMGSAAVANYGVNCTALVGQSCTRYVANQGTNRQFTLRGDTSDLIQRLYALALLNPNVAMSAQFGTNIYISNQGASSYNGMLVSLRKRFSQGLQFDFNYTLSHSIDNGSSVANTVTGGLVCDMTNLRVCRANSDFDVRHLVNANFIYELPFGRGKRFGGGSSGLANAIIGGWEVTGIFAARSGLAFTTTTTAFPRGFNFNSPAVLVGSVVPQGQLHDATNGTIQYFNDPAAALAALRFPHHGEIGNRNILRGPGFWNIDTAVLKNIGLPWEGQRIQLRWESYNALNHPSFSLPNASFTSAAFGQVTSTSSTAREMQFAIRWEF